MEKITEKQKEKAKELYEFYENKLDLKNLSKLEKSNALINYCDELQGKICNISDEIKINGYDSLESMNVNIPKKDWLEIVTNGVKHKYLNSKNLEEKSQKILDQDIYTAKLKSSILENNIIGGKEEIITPNNSNKINDNSSETNKEFTKLYDSSVNKRFIINKKLYPEYRNVFIAWNYMWDFKFEFEEFKMLVDDIHYASGGYPSASTPPRTWSRIHKFDQLVRTMLAVGKEDYIKEYLENFGIKIEIDPNKVWKEWR